LEQEISHVRAYLEINEARFVDKLTIKYDVDHNLLAEMIPPFTLQPIVENAIHHGISDMERNCLIKISVLDHHKEIEVKVADNGKGITPERIKLLGLETMESETGTGVALFNVNRRLIMTFGERAALRIESEIDKGTTISFRIPKWEESV